MEILREEHRAYRRRQREQREVAQGSQPAATAGEVENALLGAVVGASNGFNSGGSSGGSSGSGNSGSGNSGGSSGGKRSSSRNSDGNNALNALWRTQEESPLLIDSKRDKIHDGPRTIAQIDLLPTISLLLGIPIPYENLGKIIPEMFHYNRQTKDQTTRRKRGLVQSKSTTTNTNTNTSITTCADILRVSQLSNALRINALQQLRYMELYSQTTSAIPIEHFKPIIEMALTHHANASMRMEAVCVLTGSTFASKETEHVTAAKHIYQQYVVANRLYSQFMDQVYRDCRREWTQFDIPLMLVGIGILMSAVFFVFVLIFSKQMISLITIALLIVLSISHFSNSYIDSEVNILPFLATTALMAYVRRSFSQLSFRSTALHNRQQQQQQHGGRGRGRGGSLLPSPTSSCWDMLASLLAVVCVRSLSNLVILNAPITFVTTMVPLFSIVVVWMYLATSMQVVAWSTALVGLSSLLAHLLLLTHWALAGIGPTINSKRSWVVRNGIPRFVLGCALFSYLIIIVERSCCGICRPNGTNDNDENCHENKNNKRQIRAVSASNELSILFHRSLWVLPSMTLFMLLLGPGSPIAVFAIFIASLSLVFVQKRYSWHVLHRQQQSSLTSAESVSSSSRSSSGNATNVTNVTNVTNATSTQRCCPLAGAGSGENREWLNDEDVIVWWFMATLSYFATGHASTFGAIHISAAFIGIDEFHFGLSGFMLALNTWGGPIVHAIAVGTIFGKTLYYLAVVLFCFVFVSLIVLSSFFYFEGGTNDESTRARTIFLSCSGLMLLFMMLCLVVLRHHLFLWAVFAPKYVFLAATHVIYLFFHVILESFQWFVIPIRRVVDRPAQVNYKQGKSI